MGGFLGGFEKSYPKPLLDLLSGKMGQLPIIKFHPVGRFSLQGVAPLFPRLFSRTPCGCLPRAPGFLYESIESIMSQLHGWVN
jgi:hypothetical protein